MKDVDSDLQPDIFGNESVLPGVVCDQVTAVDCSSAGVISAAVQGQSWRPPSIRFVAVVVVVVVDGRVASFSSVDSLDA